MATLQAVVEELQKQNDTLVDVRTRLDQEARARSNAIRRAETERKKALEDRLEEKSKKRRDEAAIEPAGFKAGLGMGIREATGFDLLTGLKSGVGGLLQAVLAGIFGGATIKALTTRIGKIIGRGLIFGPAILLLETFGEDLFTSLITQFVEGFPDAQVSPETINALAELAVDGLKTGLFLGTFFGKKGFIAGFLGSILAEAITQVLPDDMSLDDKIKLFGLEAPITLDQLITIGSVLGAFVGPGLLYGAVTKMFGGTALAFPGANVGRDAKGRFTPKKSVKSYFFTGFGRFVGPALLIGLGATLGAYVENIADEEAGNFVANTFSAAAIGLMLAGPYGALAGGLFAMASAGLGALSNWFITRNDEVVKDAVAAAELADKKVREGTATSEDFAAIAMGNQELQRALQLPQYEGNAEFQALVEKYTNTLRQRQFDTGNDVLQSRLILEDAIRSGQSLSSIISAASAALVANKEPITVDNIQKEIDAAAFSTRMKDYDYEPSTEFLRSIGNITADMIPASRGPIVTAPKPTTVIPPASNTGSIPLAPPPLVTGQIGDTNMVLNDNSFSFPSGLVVEDQYGKLNMNGSLNLTPAY